MALLRLERSTNSAPADDHFHGGGKTFFFEGFSHCGEVQVQITLLIQISNPENDQRFVNSGIHYEVFALLSPCCITAS